MYRTHVIFLTCLFALGVLLQGCTRIGDFTALSGKNIDMQGGLHVVSERTRVSGTDWRFLFGTPEIEEALDIAVEQYGGAVGLTNVTITMYTFPFYKAFKVEGDPIVEVGGKPEDAGSDITIK